MIADLMIKKSITKYKLSKMSEIPYSTISDIVSGKAKLSNCSAETVYKLAKIFDVSMETLLEPYMVKRIDFELFKSNVCHKLKELGDIDFLIETIQSDEIRSLYNRQWYRESLYLLGMLDYISRENGVELCNTYDDLRKCKLENTIYPYSILAICAASKNDAAKEESKRNAIPEFLRFNIVENEVRNVI